MRETDRRVLRFLREHEALAPGEHVLIAVSGGPDSTALLHLMAHLNDELRLRLTIAHFDHRLRSREEAQADRDFASGQAGSLGLKAVFGEGDVRAFAASEGLSLEDAARRLRYRFLADSAARVGATAVATGHTASDQAETVLLHLLRGSGLGGLRGMPPRSDWPFGEGPTLARPLLGLSREDTVRYCEGLGIEPRQDPTNLLPDATRNRLRNQLLPFLRDYNPRVEEALVRLAAAASADDDYLEAVAREIWTEVASVEAGAVSFGREAFAALASALQVRLLRLAAEGLVQPAPQLEAVHLEAALAVLKSGRGSISLPGGLRLEVSRERVQVRLGEAVPPQPIPETPLAVPGVTFAGEWRIEAEVGPPPADATQPDPLRAVLDARALGSRPYVRSRQAGDRLRPLGLRGEKKLQDLLVDARVPAAGRDSLPLVCGDCGIAWVVGVRIAEDVAIGSQTEQAVYLKAERAAGDLTGLD